MINKIEGIQDNFERTVIVDGSIIKPSKSQEVFNHSSDGLNWGYGGSGPAQLALAILLEFTGVDTALKLYQYFKWEVVSKLPYAESFEYKLDIKKWIKSKKIVV